MQPHQERVVQEHDELKAKITKLRDFLLSPGAAQLQQTDRDEYGRLNAQLGVMSSYLFILSERIAAFKESA